MQLHCCFPFLACKQREYQPCLEGCSESGRKQSTASWSFMGRTSPWGLALVLASLLFSEFTVSWRLRHIPGKSPERAAGQVSILPSSGGNRTSHSCWGHFTEVHTCESRAGDCWVLALGLVLPSWRGNRTWAQAAPEATRSPLVMQICWCSAGIGVLPPDPSLQLLLGHRLDRHCPQLDVGFSSKEVNQRDPACSWHQGQLGIWWHEVRYS